MSLAADPQQEDVRTLVGEEEWRRRVDLAALYREIARLGWDDLIFTHLSLRVPGPNHQFLINPMGMLFEEVTASNLVKIDEKGEPVMKTPYPINQAGFVIHSALHMAREDAQCVIHLHTEDGVAVAAQEHGLLPLSQHAMVVGPVSYHDYEGIALDIDERERLVLDMGDRNAMILRNHGTLAVGPSCAVAYLRMFHLERACTIQVKALAGGVPIYQPNQGVAEKVAHQAAIGHSGVTADRAWAAVLRKLDRIDLSYQQ